jgi:vancomycin permeability regulator SanA
MHSLKKPMTLLPAVLVITIAATIIDYQTIPTHNTNLTHFDAIIVLGAPANLHGTPSPEQRERTLEGVREYKAGVAPSLILTGGPAHNQFIEAHVMAKLALVQGVPPAAVIEEDQALNTIQNTFFSQRIMAAHQWISAEVVSSPAISPRRSHPRALSPRLAHPPSPLAFRVHGLAACRALLRRSSVLPQLHLFGFPASRFIAAQGQG